MAFEKISTPSLKDVFVREVENSIISGEFPIGAKLPTEREFSQQMGVSLTVVKLGIAELENKGFIEVIPRRGLYVADFPAKGSIDTLASIIRYNGGNLSSHEICSFTELRRTLDQLAYGLAIERAPDEKIRDLGRIVKSVHKAATAAELAEEIITFYHSVYILSDNTLLPLFYYSTRVPQLEIYARFMEKNGEDFLRKRIDELYAALSARDKEETSRLIDYYNALFIEGDTAII